MQGTHPVLRLGHLQTRFYGNGTLSEPKGCMFVVIWIWRLASSQVHPAKALKFSMKSEVPNALREFGLRHRWLMDLTCHGLPKRVQGSPDRPEKAAKALVSVPDIHPLNISDRNLNPSPKGPHESPKDDVPNHPERATICERGLASPSGSNRQHFLVGYFHH